ncbi:MAG: hypothetical protein HZB92_00355 [Euryarchaeota archaeon]|nr:hypothetical protein [Euryarchaeota archaeon]
MRAKVLGIVLVIVVGMVIGFFPGNAGVSDREPVAPSSTPAAPAAGSLPELPAPESAQPPPETNGGVSAYHSYKELSAELAQISRDHANITKLISIGKTWQNRDIWAMKISDNASVEEAGEPEVYFNANHHAREWMTIEICMFAINFLTDNYGTNATVASIVNTRQVWVIPTANPDGRVYDGLNDSDDPSNHARQTYGWRKNARDNNVNGILDEANDGVDLNRNYGFMWGASGASSLYTDDTYGGPAAFSEPESRAIRDFCRQHKFIFAISFHTYSQLILYPIGYTYNNAPQPDDSVVRSVAEQMAYRITNTAGSAYPGYTPQQSSDLYMTSGSDDDWLYGELGVYAYCIEAYPNVNDADAAVTGTYDLFHPRADKVPLVCNDTLGAIIYLCQISDNPFQAMDHVSLRPQVPSIRISRGSAGNVPINVTDDGRRADTFNLANTGISGWAVSLSPGSLSLARNQTSQTTLSVNVPAGATPGTYSITVYGNSTSNTSCSSNCTVAVEVPWTDDASAPAISPFVELGTYPMGNYRIGGSVQNVGDAQSPSFNAYCNITRLGATSTMTLFSDNGEGGAGKWNVIDIDGNTSTDYWHLSTLQKHAGTYSWWCGLDARSNYTAITVQSMEMAQPLNLRTATGLNVSYWTYYSTEANYDFCVVEASRDNGRTWEYLTRYNGTGTAWTNRTLDLSGFAGASQFRMRFRFSADEATAPAAPCGFWWDDLFITAQMASEASVFGPSPLPTPVLNSQQSTVLNWTYNFTQGGRYRVSTTTFYGPDGNAANNYTDVLITINAGKALPDFAGADRAANTGTGASLNVYWNAANDPNGPITYSVWRFDHSPSEAEVNGTAPTWTGAALSYTDPGLASYATYYYVVRASDSFGQKDYNMVVRNATTDALLYFQMQSSVGGYRDLALDTFETGVQIATSASLGSAGQYKLGGAGDRWLSAAYAQAQDMNGTWKFRVNGKTDFSSAHGYLYSLVKRYSDDATIFGAQDDEDIALYPSVYREFYWTYNVPAGTTLPAGDRFVVELWLNITSVTSGASFANYTYQGVTQASGAHDAWFCDVVDSTQAQLIGPSGGNPSTVQLTDANYVSIAASDNSRATSVNPGAGNEIFVKYSFLVNETASTITAINLAHEAQYSAAITATLYAWNVATAQWVAQGATQAYAAATDAWMNRSITTSCANYVSQGSVIWGVYASATATCSVDCSQVGINYTAPVSSFAFGYDNDATPSSVLPIMNTVGGSYVPWLNISVVLGWNLVSVPFVGPTALPTALTDKADGGAGLVQWDRMQAYNPGTPSNPWGQYYTGWNSSLNDLTAVNHLMGVWLYVTSVGDGQLCLGGTGYSNSTNASIPLDQGWNLVGYPARDDSTYTAGQLMSATGATIVEGFSAPATYKTAVLAGSTVLKKGQAYWVYCPSATTWWVDW